MEQKDNYINGYSFFKLVFINKRFLNFIFNNSLKKIFHSNHDILSLTLSHLKFIFYT